MSKSALTVLIFVLQAPSNSVPYQMLQTSDLLCATAKQSQRKYIATWKTKLSMCESVGEE